MLEGWKELILLFVCKKGDKTDCSDYRGISMLSTTYWISPHILLSRLTPYTEEILWDCQCGFWSNRSTADLLLCIHQKFENKWDWSEAVHQIFIDSEKAYDSIRKEFFCNILSEIGIPMKLVRLIKMCLKETYSRVWVGKHWSDMFHIKNGLKPGDT